MKTPRYNRVSNKAQFCDNSTTAWLESAIMLPRFSFVGMTGDLFEAIRCPTGLKQCMNRPAYLLAKLLFPRLPGDMRRRRLNNLFTVLFISLIVMGGVVLAIIITEKGSK
jgi:hypothetical protein